MLSAVLASACLSVLQWLMWGTAALLVLLIVVQFWRGDADAQPGVNVALAVAVGLLGWILGAAGRRLARR